MLKFMFWIVNILNAKKYGMSFKANFKYINITVLINH